LGVLGLALAPLHLGRPLYAFRAILGWRHSWLSREALVFGPYAGAAVGAAALAALPLLPAEWVDPALAWVPVPVSWLRPPVELAAIASGAVGVFCSAMIYVFTRRVFWHGARTFLKFGLTPLTAGGSLALAAWTVVHAARGEPIGPTAGWLAGVVVAASCVKLALEAWLVSWLTRPEHPLAWSAGLMTGPLATPFALRVGCAAAGAALALCVPLTSASPGLMAAMALASLPLVLAGEVAERYLYFSAVVPLKMPGGIRA